VLEARKLPVVFSVEEVSDILMAALGPGLKYRAALSISYGARRGAAEVCNLKIGDIDRYRMLIHVELGTASQMPQNATGCITRTRSRQAVPNAQGRHLRSSHS
jgi:integrase